MTYVVLARKYRPRDFTEMVGPEHVVRSLSNALTQGRLHHAYLFTGTRGVGKTTVSRVLAKSLNPGRRGTSDVAAWRGADLPARGLSGGGLPGLRGPAFACPVRGDRLSSRAEGLWPMRESAMKAVVFLGFSEPRRPGQRLRVFRACPSSALKGARSRREAQP
jgi:DNA polymerase III delta prime subunit